MLPFPAGEFIGGRFEVVEGPNESPGFVGGFSLVYLCLDRRRSNFPCALKTLRPELAGHETRKMLLQEGATWVQIGRHQHLVQCYDLFTADSGQVFLVLELIAPPPYHRGVSLRTWVLPGISLPNDLALKFTLQIARGMRHAVSRIPGLVHRDLKPENVLIGYDLQARVIDFGLAMVASSQLSAHDLGIESVKEPHRATTNFGNGVAGTPLYMAPEAWTGTTLDQRADIYSLGCILKEMVTGLSPVEGRSVEDLQSAQLSGQAAKTSMVRVDALRLLISRLAATKPNDRPSTWQAAVAEIESSFRQILRVEPPVEQKLEATRVDLIREGGALLAIANAYRTLGRTDMARSYLQQVFKRAEEGGDEELAMDSSAAMAGILDEMGSTEEAIKLEKRCLSWYKSNKNLLGIASTVGNLGRYYRRTGNNVLALELSDLALQTYRELGDRKGESTELQMRANTHVALKQWDKAIQAFTESMKIADGIKNELLVGINLFRLGQILCVLGKWLEARVCLREALLLYNRNGRRDYAEDVSKVIETFKKVGSFSSARMEVALDRLFELGFTPEGVRQAVEEYPELLAPRILRQFQGVSIHEVGLAVLVERVGYIGEALQNCARDPVLESRARRAAPSVEKEQPNEAEAWFARAAELHAGRTAPPNYEAALEALQRAADLGHPKAMFNLGVYCRDGIGTSQSHSQAVMWWMKAAALGDEEAAFNLSSSYHDGRGVDRNPREAFRWCLVAAQRGLRDAQFNCGIYYERGLGCERDPRKAMQWYGKAVEQGDWRAECNLGTLYANGEGVARNWVDACYWFSRSLIDLDMNKNVEHVDLLRHHIGRCLVSMSKDELSQMTLRVAAYVSQLEPERQSRATAVLQNLVDWAMKKRRNS